MRTGEVSDQSKGNQRISCFVIRDHSDVSLIEIKAIVILIMVSSRHKLHLTNMTLDLSRSYNTF